jgi:hypothetical protein
MSFSNIQRRAFVVALITMAGVVTVVLCYWQAVSKGVLPSPVQPMVGPATGAAPQPAKVSARAPAPSPPRPPEPITEASVTVPTVAEQQHSQSRVLAPDSLQAEATTSQTGHTNETLNPPAPARVAADMPDGRTGAPQPAAPNAADEKLAEHWLSNTNERPVVRVHYDPADILRLVELGRGVIVASSQHKAHQRDLYLQSRPDTAPLFVPYTKGVADRFSSYSLILDPSPALAPLTTALPVYFPDAAVVLAFVPDHVLATEVFGQVAQARRTVAKDFPRSRQTVFEGQLTLRGAEPSFNLLQVQSGTKSVLLSASGAERD